jgi:hypothetical protein
MKIIKNLSALCELCGLKISATETLRARRKIEIKNLSVLCDSVAKKKILKNLSVLRDSVAKEKY